MMTRLLLLTGWLGLAAAVGVWHLGEGVMQAKLDDVATQLRLAEEAANDESYSEAIEAYDKALSLLPTERREEARTIRVAKAKVMLMGQKLAEARPELENLVEELSSDPTADPKLLAQAREGLASSQYYNTWLMRLEGQGHEAWGPEIDAARQNYRWLAESASARGDTLAARKHQEDLEAAIRLDRMELKELQALPLPKQCKGCCSCKSNKPNKNKGPKLPKQDIRSGGGAPPLDNSGH